MDGSLISAWKPEPQAQTYRTARSAARARGKIISAYQT
jgi:hypothetical protein